MAKKKFASSIETGIQGLFHVHDEDKPVENITLNTSFTEVEHIKPTASKEIQHKNSSVASLLITEQEKKSVIAVRGLIEELFEVAGKKNIKVKLTDIAKQLNLSYPTLMEAKKTLQSQKQYEFSLEGRITVIKKV